MRLVLHGTHYQGLSRYESRSLQSVEVGYVVTGTEPISLSGLWWIETWPWTINEHHAFVHMIYKHLWYIYSVPTLLNTCLAVSQKCPKWSYKHPALPDVLSIHCQVCWALPCLTTGSCLIVPSWPVSTWTPEMLGKAWWILVGLKSCTNVQGLLTNNMCFCTTSLLDIPSDLCLISKQI